MYPFFFFAPVPVITFYFSRANIYSYFLLQVRSGVDCPTQSNATQVALATVRVLQHTVPVAVPGITFLSGGMSEEEASCALNEMNKLDTVRPWSLTFSYGRALQQSCLAAWKGLPENEAAAQAQLLVRAKANSEAQQGVYVGGVEGTASSTNLAVANYSY
jgi:fructose-bisphosphate aldolase class I